MHDTNRINLKEYCRIYCFHYIEVHWFFLKNKGGCSQFLSPSDIKKSEISALKVMIIAFEKQMTMLWPRVSKIIRELLGKKVGGPALYSFVDFVVDANLPISLIILPLLQSKVIFYSVLKIRIMAFIFLFLQKFSTSFSSHRGSFSTVKWKYLKYWSFCSSLANLNKLFSVFFLCRSLRKHQQNKKQLGSQNSKNAWTVWAEHLLWKFEATELFWLNFRKSCKQWRKISPQELLVILWVLELPRIAQRGTHFFPRACNLFPPRSPNFQCGAVNVTEPVRTEHICNLYCPLCRLEHILQWIRLVFSFLEPVSHKIGPWHLIVVQEWQRLRQCRSTAGFRATSGMTKRRYAIFVWLS